MGKDWSEFVRKKIKKYVMNDILFTKLNLLDWLEERNKCTVKEMKSELHQLENLVFVEKQEVLYEGINEERYRCYFVYSRSRGRCYILRFNAPIKVITVFPLGRVTLRKYKKRFK